MALRAKLYWLIYKFHKLHPIITVIHEFMNETIQWLKSYSRHCRQNVARNKLAKFPPWVKGSIAPQRLSLLVLKRNSRNLFEGSNQYPNFRTCEVAEICRFNSNVSITARVDQETFKLSGIVLFLLYYLHYRGMGPARGRARPSIPWPVPRMRGARPRPLTNII